MNNSRSLPLFVLASALVCSAAAMAQQAAPAARIVSSIDESRLATLKGNTLPVANASNDRGRVSDSLPMTDLILVLGRSPEQQAAFDAFVASQYDQSSPNYHQWLTPQQVGEQFGPSTTDIATIGSWLTGRGFTVTQVTNDRMTIRFNGTAGLVRSAFHTEIHNISVKGKAHIANMSDPQIPAALAPVVVGVKALHNFFPRPLHHMGQTVQRDAQTGKWARPGTATGLGTAATARTPSGAAAEGTAKPQFGISVTGTTPYLMEDVGPWDFATIYNITPLWNANIDGTGQTIAIAGTSAIDIGETSAQVAGANGYNDVGTFRSFFDLPTNHSYNTPIQINGSPNGEAPLTVCTSTSSTAACNLDDLLENSLDVEWSGAIAPNAQIILVASYPASATDDNLYDSESYIVNNLTARIMNVSYGECELGMGTGGNVEYYNLWQTAASEGISVFVAAGDSGSASCDDGGYVAEEGLSVSGLASTPFNTAVGGTDFNWCAPQNFFNSPTTECTASPYWNSTSNTTNQSTAKGYVPEVPWNDTCTNPLALTWMQDMASELFSLPVSDVSTTEQGCNFVYDYSTSSRLGYSYPYGEYLVEVVGGSGGPSNCVANSSTETTVGTCTTGATSTGVSTNPDTGAGQSSLTLYNNGWPKPFWQTGITPSDGVRDIPDVSFFAADGYLSSSAYLICVSAAAAYYGGGVACSYSSSSEPFAEEVGGTSVATPAMAGIMALINQHAGAIQGNPNAELYDLAGRQNYSNCSAESVTTSSSCYFNDIDKYTIAMPCDAVDSTPNCSATQSTLGSKDLIGITTGYSAGVGYDLATGLGSLNVANVVNAWPTGAPAGTFSLSATNVSMGAGATTGNTSTITVAPTDGFTGTVNFTCSVTSTPAGATSPVTCGTIASATVSGSAEATTTMTVGSTSTTTSGTYDIAVTGTSGSIVQHATVVVTVAPTYTVTAGAAPSISSPGGSTTSAITVTGSGGYAGSVTLSCSLTSGPSNQSGDAPTCSITSGSPVTLTATTTSGQATATVSTVAATSSELVHPSFGKGKGWLGGAGSGAVLALVFFFGIPKRRRSWRSMLGILVALAAIGALSSCGSSVNTVTSSNPGTATGTYTFTVTSSTTGATVTPTPTATFQVVVN